MRYDDSLSSLSLVSMHSGDFPIQSSTWQVEVLGHVRVNRLKPRPQYYMRIRSMRSLPMCPSSNYGDVILFMRDSGCSLSFSLHPRINYFSVVMR